MDIFLCLLYSEARIGHLKANEVDLQNGAFPWMGRPSKAVLAFS